MEKNESKILLFGGTGYIGSNIVKASIKLGHPTYVFSRPDSNKIGILNEFQSMGAIIVKGRLDEHEKLVSIIKEVDVVISALAYPQVLDQIKILEAIKVAGNIKRRRGEFDVQLKMQIFLTLMSLQIALVFILSTIYSTRLIQNETSLFIALVKLNVQTSKFLCLVLNYEEDIGIYTVKVATDPRTRNRTVIFRPPTSIISQLELISLWEKKTGRSFNKIHVSEEELVTLSQSNLGDPQNIPVSILHSVFIRGETTNFDIGENDIEASALYIS
ncbi:hypothetical protein ACS0TY_028019 [Phlomoides rotata]